MSRARPIHNAAIKSSLESEGFLAYHHEAHHRRDISSTSRNLGGLGLDSWGEIM